MKQRIRLRYAPNETAILEQRSDSTTHKIELSLYELRGIVEFLKNPTDAPYVFYSQHPEPLRVTFNLDDATYEIVRGETILTGVRGNPIQADEEPQVQVESRKNAFKVFKELIGRLGRKKGQEASQA